MSIEPDARSRIERPRRCESIPGGGPCLSTRRVMGLDLIDNTDVTAVVDALVRPQPDDGKLPLLATPNTDDIVRMARPGYRDIAALLTRARYLLPDGQPVVWASRLLGAPLRARLPGADLVTPLWNALRRERIPTVAVVARPQVATALDEPDDRLEILVPGRFDPDDSASYERFATELASVCDRIEARHAIIGIGFPHQQRLAQHLERLLGAQMPLTSLLGGALEFHIGATTRAPRWMRDHGLEWAHRLGRNPRRLTRRYLIDDPAFLAIVARHWRLECRHDEIAHSPGPRAPREVTRCR